MKNILLSLLVILLIGVKPGSALADHVSENKCITIAAVLELARHKSDQFNVDKHYYVKGVAAESFASKVQGMPGGINKLWVVYLVHPTTKQMAGLVYFLDKNDCAVFYVEANVGMLDILFMDMRYDVGEGLPPVEEEDDSDELSIDGI
jgi:hypothetical protein